MNYLCFDIFILSLLLKIFNAHSFLSLYLLCQTFLELDMFETILENILELLICFIAFISCLILFFELSVMLFFYQELFFIILFHKLVILLWLIDLVTQVHWRLNLYCLSFSIFIIVNLFYFLGLFLYFSFNFHHFLIAEIL